jgi:hypothetical protein
MIRHHMLRAREFFGQFEARQLVLWLQTNQYPKRKKWISEQDRTAEFERVYRLLLLLQKTELLRQVQPTPSRKEHMERIALIQEINDHLGQYTYRLRIGDSLETGWVEAIPPKVLPSEEKAVMYMVRLSELGSLQRVRPCKWCTSWFFAKYRHQLYCKQSCQQKAYSVTPEWREHRRDYMRKYRSENS